MDSQVIVVVAVVIAVVLILAIVAVVLRMARQKKAETDRQRAAELRSRAVSDTDELHRAEQKAREADHAAEGRRLEAEKAEALAAEARREEAAEQARIEDQMRVADRVDPDVNHRAKDYAPQSPTTTTSHGEDHRQPLAERDPSLLTGSHRAETTDTAEPARQPETTGQRVRSESTHPTTPPATSPPTTTGPDATQVGSSHAGSPHPAGSVANGDGTFTYPDGSVRHPDGSTVDPGA